VLWLSGDWDAAAPFWQEVRGDRPDRSADLPPIAFLNLIAAARGEPGLEVRLDELAPGPDAPGLACYHELATALALAASGANSAAVSHVVAAFDKYLAIAGLDDDFCIFWVTAVEMSLEVGDLAQAARLIDVVASAPPGKVTPYMRAQVPRMQAALALASGDEDVDIDALLVQSEALLRHFGSPLYLGQALLQHAEWHVLNGSGAAAQPLLDEAQRIFAELRARPWLDRAVNAQTLVVS
jgi:hypothetical protein